MTATTSTSSSTSSTPSTNLTTSSTPPTSNATQPASSSSTPASPLRSLFLHTHDVARNLKPSSDGELANALHETLHFALDGEEEDWGIRNDRDKEEDRGCGGSNSQNSNPTDPVISHSISTSTSTTSNPTTSSSSPLPKARPGFFLSSNPNRPYISYSWDEKSNSLSLPNPSLISNPTQLDPCSPEKRNDFDVTAKLFFLGKPSEGEGGYKEDYIDQALRRLMLTTGLITVDTLILAFPKLKFDGFGRNENDGKNGKTPCGEGLVDGNQNGNKEGNSPLNKEEQQRLERDVEYVRKLWQTVPPNPQCVSLGLSDFSLPALKSLFDSFSPPPPPPPPTSSSTPTSDPATPTSPSNPTSSLSERLKSSESDCNQSQSSTIPIPVVAPPVEDSPPSAFTTPSQTRRPRVVTINVKEDPCSFDRELSRWCQEQGMQVLSHGDRRDILPDHTLNSLLSEFTADLPHPLPTDGSLRAKWVLKYSVLIESRGVLADRGYIVYADTEE